MSTHSYPVRVDATLQEDRLSRWLWLVKWLLAIPHFLVLALLWVAFVVLSVIALVSILFTGRYPRAIFDFNVGVLRWSWRVTYYAYGGLATDQYPPFTLDERPDYPAHLEVEYPDHLSRGLVLVKWWLLALPHYLVVALFLGAGWAATDSTQRGGTPGLITVLVLVAAVVLLFTGRYPRSIFDLVLGLNRWVLRVAAYAALMTDEYPPFRLDLGGDDPGSGPGALTMGSTLAAASASAPSSAPSSAPAPAWAPAPAPAPVELAKPAPSGRGPGRWGAGRIIAVIVGSVLVLTSLGLLGAGAVLRGADSFARDADGFLMSEPVTVTSTGYAATSQSVDLWKGTVDLALPERWLGTLKVRVDTQRPGDVFVGIGRTTAVETYLTGVAHSQVVDVQSGDATMQATAGGAPTVAPNGALRWVAAEQGPGRQTISWPATSGRWTVVVMNADGSTPVAADVSVGATVPVLDDVIVGLLVSGLVMLLLGAGVLVVALRPRNPHPV